MNNEKDDNASKVDITNSKHKSKSPSPPTVTVTSEDDTSNSVLQNIPSPTLNSTATSNESSSKKHRPSSLNLKVTDKSNSDVALRIVSPGLPQLNEEMKTTVKISQKIEQQQKNLIAARHLNSANSSSEKELVHEENNNDVDLSEPQVSTSNNNEDFDRLSTPSSAKRLKRNNIPTPLNIPNKSSVRPSIQSAPIRPQQQPQQHMKRSYKQVAYAYQPQPSPSFAQPMVSSYGQYYQIPQHQYLNPSMQVPQYSYQNHPYKRIRMYAPPYTSSQQSFPRPVSRGAYPSQYQSPSNIPSSPNQSSVTDVYNGDYTKAAPLNSQPLSAQRDFFENGPSSRLALAKHSKRNIHDDDRLPVSEEEVREMQEKYNSMVNNNNDDDSKNRDSRGLSLVDGDDIFGSINLMNESVFNFRIFNSKSSTSENTHNNSAAQKKGDNRLSKEKEKFLKICETSWDEFVSNKI
ncbi:hypothetical protein HYPBUDRAFT_102629 [Hyphopichia burtonii NRRL Y-1933]|uniref:Uncharacterized protein n=1 Tax=Hyphopichia burtonii NRRL Y-1933 TaxID=984485 RepID=A0A1E4RQ72_9ASCO|nr:hypothetical protein HYPBUDRAFT_102629 [Hyphopichia burtonii NRRL Y-1933]ODV69433.1 hypothetical protein HYPBUDRAFT_102629 [Hyphopichia burtonii NRRL Y-1933]